MSTMERLDKYVTVKDAARIIGCTTGRVRQLIYADAIEAEQVGGHIWMVLRKAAEKMGGEPSRVGRPRVSKK